MVYFKYVLVSAHIWTGVLYLDSATSPALEARCDHRPVPFLAPTERIFELNLFGKVKFWLPPISLHEQRLSLPIASTRI